MMTIKTCVMCPACNGVGSVWGKGNEVRFTCWECLGTGGEWRRMAEERGVTKGYSNALRKLLHEGWEEPQASHIALALALDAKAREGKG